MKVIIAGSRDITDYSILLEAVEKSGFDINCVISGTARGPDKMGEKWAMDHIGINMVKLLVIFVIMKWENWRMVQ